MAAAITGTGTWSSLDNTNPVSQAPGDVGNEVIRVHRDTVEQRLRPRALDPALAIRLDVDGFQEVNQFIGLFAAGYGIPGLAAITRMRDILEAMLVVADRPEQQRVYTAV
jgi:hypothetical protein